MSSESIAANARSARDATSRQPQHAPLEHTKADGQERSNDETRRRFKTQAREKDVFAEQ